MVHTALTHVKTSGNWEIMAAGQAVEGAAMAASVQLRGLESKPKLNGREVKLAPCRLVGACWCHAAGACP